MSRKGCADVMNEGGADGGELPRKMSTGLRGLDVEEGWAGRQRDERREEDGEETVQTCVLAGA